MYYNNFRQEHEICIDISNSRSFTIHCIKEGKNCDFLENEVITFHQVAYFKLHLPSFNMLKFPSLPVVQIN